MSAATRRYLTPLGRIVVLGLILVPAAVAACSIIMTPNRFGFGG